MKKVLSKIKAMIILAKERRRKRAIRRLIFTRYDFILNSAIKTCVKYDISLLPQLALVNILDQAHFNQKEVHFFKGCKNECENFNNSLKALFLSVKNKDGIKVDHIEACIKSLKTGYLISESKK